MPADLGSTAGGQAGDGSRRAQHCSVNEKRPELVSPRAATSPERMPEHARRTGTAAAMSLNALPTCRRAGRRQRSQEARSASPRGGGAWAARGRRPLKHLRSRSGPALRVVG